MADKTYDIAIVGGGIAGSALAKVMAEQGGRVLVLEREIAFRDRVRGEALMPWGTAEAKELGILDTMMASGGHELRWWDSYQGATRTGHRELPSTTTPKTAATTFFHPQIQECLIQGAADAGAEVRRGARVIGISLEAAPSVTVDVDGQQRVVHARLVVGSDGKDSLIRAAGGFSIKRDRGHNLVAGILLDDCPVSDDACHAWLEPDLGLWILIFPQGEGRARAYVCYPESAGYRLSGERDIPRFIEQAVRAGVPAEHYTSAKPAGPLATFEGAASWVEHPYRGGLALIGSAAADPDPTWGQGLSMALRDVRVLRDNLLRNENWEEEGNAYAVEHDQYYGVVHDVELWQTQLLLETGGEAENRRDRVFATWREDRTRRLDTMMSGPGPTLDEEARRHFFAED